MTAGAGERIGRGAGADAFCAGFDIGALRPGDVDAVQRGNTALYDALAAEVAGHAPLSVGGAKAMLARVRHAAAAIAHDDLDTLVRQARASQDFRDGRRAFLEQRPPRFVGR